MRLYGCSFWHHMPRHISSPDKLLRIIETQRRLVPSDPFVFSIDESLRIRQLIAQSLVDFFAALNDLPSPGQLPIPAEAKGLLLESRPSKRKKR